MFEMGWRTKAEKLRMTLLSAGHQMAGELPQSLVRILREFETAAETGDVTKLVTLVGSPADETERKQLWEPAAIYGWHFNATFYRREQELWWLCHASRANPCVPSDKELSFLDKVLVVLGCDQKTDTIIGPSRTPPGEDTLPFGWWTWRNVAPLYEIQVNKAKKGSSMMRVVRLGAPESDGYVSVDLSRRADEELEQR